MPFFRNDAEVAQALDYYRPLVGMQIEGVLANTAWPTLLCSHPKLPGREFEISAACDREGNGPGFLFFETDDPTREEFVVEGARITAVEIVQDRYEDYIYWPTLFCELADGAGTLKIEVSIDPEGNDGGHLFGVPPQTDLDLLLAAVAV
jgi:hypothetical protein